jgi:hypothetical protein
MWAAFESALGAGFYEAVGAGVDQAFVSVCEANQVRGSTLTAADFEDFAQALLDADHAAVNVQPVAHQCVHFTTPPVRPE